MPKNTEIVSNFIGELKRQDPNLAASCEKLANGEKKRFVVTALSAAEAARYRKYGINGGARLWLNVFSFRHLVNSGHIGGLKKSGLKDDSPLSVEDFLNLRQIFKNPGKIYRSGGRIIIENKTGKKHRLVVEMNKNQKDVDLVTYFNISKARKK